MKVDHLMNRAVSAEREAERLRKECQKVERERDNALLASQANHLAKIDWYDRAKAAEAEVALLRKNLSEAVEELRECRSFIRVETQHWPTVRGLTEVIDRLGGDS